MYTAKFEVKTGENAGFYIVTMKKDQKAYDIMAKSWGIIVAENGNQGFYNYHGVNQYDCYIWTHTRYTGKYNAYNRERQEELYKELQSIQ